MHEKNDFAEKSKILLDTDLQIIQLKIMSNAAKNFDILATSLSVLIIIIINIIIINIIINIIILIIQRN